MYKLNMEQTYVALCCDYEFCERNTPSDVFLNLKISDTENKINRYHIDYMTVGIINGIKRALREREIASNTMSTAEDFLACYLVVVSAKSCMLSKNISKNKMLEHIINKYGVGFTKDFTDEGKQFVESYLNKIE